MMLLALKMLINDRAKYFGLIVGITFATLLIGQQLSVFVAALSQTVSMVEDIGHGQIWVGRQKAETIDGAEMLRATDVFRVRGVEGVHSAVELYLGGAVSRTRDGRVRRVTVVGLDDVTLTGAPPRMLWGSVQRLRESDAVIVDTMTRRMVFAGSVEPGEEIEINRQRLEVVGLCWSRPQFAGMPLIYARRTVAARLTNEPQHAANWILVEVTPGADIEAVAQRISDATGLVAQSRAALSREVIDFHFWESGIVEVLGLAILLGMIVGTVIVGQIFYMFAVENLRHFAAMKAIGLGSGKLLAMIVAQAGLVAVLGCGLGLGLTALFFKLVGDDDSPLRGMGIPAEVAVVTCVVVIGMTMLSGLLSARKVIHAEPAIVFRA